MPAMEVSINEFTPSHHPFKFIDGIFHEIHHLAIGVPPWPWKPPSMMSTKNKIRDAYDPRGGSNFLPHPRFVSSKQFIKRGHLGHWGYPFIVGWLTYHGESFQKVMMTGGYTQIPYVVYVVEIDLEWLDQSPKCMLH